MSEAGASSLRQRVSVSEMLDRKSKAAPAAKLTERSRFADIASNPVHSIVMSKELSPEQKKVELAKFRVADVPKAELRERNKQYDEFKEYLQEKREEMAKQIISLTDTETFAELQSAYRDINDDFIEYENRMMPLTDLIEAVYVLRSSGKTLDAFKEIKADQEGEVRRAEETREAQETFNGLKSRIDWIDGEVAGLRTEKLFFGFGGIKPEAAARIAGLELDRERLVEELSIVEKRMIELRSTSTVSGSVLSSDDPDETRRLLDAKEKLSELLNLSSEQHTQRQKELVSAAISFIETSKERIGGIREHLTGMEGQIDRLGDTNGRMSEIYAIMTEAEKEASVKNQELREKLVTAPSEEDAIAKMTREGKLRDVDEHIKAVAQSTVDTQATYADLASGAIRIMTMKDATSTQQVKAREFQSRGVAGIADRLSTVLQAVSGAAISEAQAMAGNTLKMMADSTNLIAQKESIRVAMGIQDTNDDLLRIAEDLESYGDVSRQSTDIIRTGLVEMNENLERIAAIRDDVEQGIREAHGVTAEVTSGRSSSTKVGKATKSASDDWAA